MKSSTDQRPKSPEALAGLLSANGPLTGLRVVDLTDDHPGALVTMFLADFGADVIKLVRPGGNPLEKRQAFDVWNRGKRSYETAFWSGPARPSSAPGAIEADRVRDLIRGADIVVESLGPGGAAGIGLDYAGSAARNGGLIWLSITPYGPDGPLAGRPGYEGTVAAVTGILTEQRASDGAPMWNALPLAGVGTALLGILGVLSALHRREVTGRGQMVSTSMFQGSLAARSPMLVRGEGVQTWDSAGSDPQGALPNYRLYETADGKWIHIGALVPDFWNKLSIAADLFELVTDPRFESAPLYWPDEETRAAAKEIIGARIRQKPRDEWLQILRDGDVPVAPAMSSHELMDHYQVVANGLQVTGHNGVRANMEQIAPPIRLFSSPWDLAWLMRGEMNPDDRWPEWLAERPGPSLGVPPAPEPEFKGPLSGVRVLDLSSYLAGPIGPAYLADFGADVIKVEPSTGEGCRMLMMLYLGGNTGKRDLALDIRADEAKGVLERLISRSDIVLHNNRVGVAERIGIDYETVRKINPNVIYLHSTGFGSEGPDAPRPGFDPLAQSFTGISQAQGGPGKPPVFPKTPICDISTAMLGGAAMLLGLYHRDRTGRGQRLETSLLATGLWLKSDSFVRNEGWSPPVLTNSDNSGLCATYRAYRAADRHIFIGARLDEEREALAGLLDMPELADAIEGEPGDEALAKRVAAVIREKPAAEWLLALGAAGVPSELVAEDIDEGVYANPQAAHLNSLAFPDYPGFTNLRQPGLLVDFSESPGERRSGSPALGEHTEDVLAQFGYSPDEIAALEASGVISVFKGEDEIS
ncbi:MAG: CoA transferase [Chloroflexi bacterium]|nr:CoA transferase [Chloroflexota bacterium]